MSRRIEEIDERISEVKKIVQSERALKKRVFEATNEFYAKQEKSEIAGLNSILENLVQKPASIDEFFKAQEEEASRRLEIVTPLLQLTDAEIQRFELENRAQLLIDPCLFVPAGSPEWKCIFLATDCDCDPTETDNASAVCSCTPASGSNEFNAKVEARGQGTNFRKTASTDCSFFFDIPARTNPVNVEVRVKLRIHGFYVVRSALYSSSVKLIVKAEGYQYGHSWGSASSVVVNQSGDTMGRIDTNEYLVFTMPTGADPFQVHVSIDLEAIGKGGGSLAVGDFSTGNGNFIQAVYVNTFG